MPYQYLSEDRPAVAPDRLEAVVFLRPGTSWWADVGGNPVFVKPNGDVDEDVIPPTDEEIDEIHSILLEEWKEEEQRVEFRRHLNNITRAEWFLWKDIDNDIIPGKSGKFYSLIKDMVDKYDGEVDSPFKE